MTLAGLPHSGIHGSKHAYCSPWRFAARRALLRLLAPRHPPYALSSLTKRLRYIRFLDVYPNLQLIFFLCAVFKEQLETKKPFKFYYGGGKRDRTADPLLARQVLSQLSYTPTIST